MGRKLEPLTERILERLRGPRLFWILVWALVPPLNAGANLLLEPHARSAVWDQSRTIIVLNYVALSLAVVITFWGVRRIARRVQELGVSAEVLEIDASRHFRELNSFLPPIVAAAAAATTFGVSALVADGWVAGILRGATWFVLGIPMWTFLWTYVSLQLGLDRLGRERLHPDRLGVDPSLGLRPVGAIAFSALWMLLAWLVPIVLTGLSDVTGFVLGLLVLGAALLSFFLSLFRLHRQMVAVKTNEIEVARDLYAQAYEPVRTARALDVLEQQHSLLGAADALEQRARAIQEWPIDDATVTRVITIATSVLTIAIARLILDPLGL